MSGKFRLTALKFRSLPHPQNEETESPNDDSNPDDNYPHGPRLVLTGMALCMTIFLVALDGTIVSTAIPTIADEFRSLSDVGWYGSAFFLTMAAFQAFWGKAYKYFLLKWMFLLAVFLFELGSLICGVAPNSTALIVGRAVAGTGAAGISSGVYTIAAFSVSVDKRPVFLGVMGAFYGIASAIGPLIGGALTSNVSWRWCFYINLPIGGAAAAMILLCFRTPEKARPTPATLREKFMQLNPISVMLIMAAVVCYLLALQWAGQSKPWSDSTVIGTLVGFVVILAVFIGTEQFMGDRALLQPRMFKIRTVTLACPFVFFMTGAYSTIVYFVPLYFQFVRGISAEQSGVRTLALVIALALFLLVSGGVVRNVGYFKQNLIIGSCFATIGCGLIYTLEIDTSAGRWIGYQIIVGAGVGFAWQPALVASQASVKPSDIALVTSTVLFFQTVGGAFFISAAECAFANQLLHSIKSLAPEINPDTVLSSAGASNLHTSFSGAVLTRVLQSYLDGLHTAYALAIASAGIAALLSLGAESKKVNMEQVLKQQGAPSGEGGTDHPEDSEKKSDVAESEKQSEASGSEHHPEAREETAL